MSGTSPTSKPVQPDATSQEASAYKAAIDASVNAQARLGWAFAPHAQDTPNMTVRLEAGSILSGVTLTEVAAQSTGTITAPSANPRIDRVVIDRATGAVSVVTGSEGASPSAPAIPTGKLPVARIALTVGMTAITNADLTDERVVSGVGLGAAAYVNIGATPGLIPVLNVNGRLDVALLGSGTPNATKVLNGEGAWVLPSSLPVGTSIAMAGETVPAGYLEENGAAVSRTTYAALFAYLGTTHGQGDGTTTFNLPDSRGVFHRGWDHGRGVDPDRASRTAAATGGLTGDHVGSAQADAFKAHTHTATSVGGQTTYGSNPVYSANSADTGSTGGNETRPRNTYRMYCIKY